LDVIEGLDTPRLEGLGKPGRGWPGYDPRMLAVPLVYSYLQGERSSRRIEGRCRTDAASGMDQPTIFEQGMVSARVAPVRARRCRLPVVLSWHSACHC
jgi:hypothetical protein